MIVFALKYLDKGIEYSRVITNQNFLKAIFYTTVVLYSLYFLVCFGGAMYVFATSPVFKPSEGIGNAECDAEWAIFMDKYSRWLKNVKHPIFDPIILSQAVYYSICSVFTFIGVSLIYRTNRKTIFRHKKV